MKNSIKFSMLLIVLIINLHVSGQSIIENLGKNVNSVYSELRPTISPDGKILYFVVQGNPLNNNHKKDKSIQDVWYSTLDSNGVWTKAERCPSSINLTSGNAVFWISLDGKSILIRGAFEDGKYLGRGFSLCNKNGSTWSNPQRLKIKGYNNMSVDEFDGAYLSTDGKKLLLYMSEEKNSLLNDIYVSFSEKDNEWTRPQKIMDDVSTLDYNEISPFLSSDDITMYFSSNRPGGFGNYDIWMTKRIDETWTKWSKPVNMGSSINSSKWDAYFSTDAKGEYGYISSKTKSIGGTDIGRVKLTDNQKPNPVVFVYGKIQTENPNDSIVGLQVAFNEILDKVDSVEQIQNKSIKSIVDSTDNSYRGILPYGKKYGLKITADNYKTHIDTLDLVNQGSYQELHNQTSLKVENSKIENKIDTGNIVKKGKNKIEKKKNIDALKEISNSSNIEVGETYLIDNILFDFDKSILNKSSFEQLNKAVILLKKNPRVKIELSAHTDSVGSVIYNDSLSNKRAKVAAEYIISKGVAPKRISSKGYGDSMPIETNETPEGRSLNRRVEIKIIQK